MLKTIARKVVLPTAMGIGADRLVRSIGGKHLLNVMYHGVVREDSTWFSPRHTTAEAFASQLKYFNENFDIVSLKEAFELRDSGRRLERHTITISFDDGYRNNLEIALPIIEKFGVPVTFFVLGPCAETHGDRVSWTDLMAALPKVVNGGHVRVLDGDYVDGVELSSGRTLMDDLKAASPTARDNAIRQLDDAYDLKKYLKGLDSEIWELMGPDQLISLASSPCVEIGSHAYAHYNLGLVPLADAVHDMARSKEAIEGLLGRTIESIAYPDGSYNDPVKDAAERLGFKRQLAVDPRCASDAQDARIQSRHGVPATTTTASAMFFVNYAFGQRGVL